MPQIVEQLMASRGRLDPQGGHAAVLEASGRLGCEPAVLEAILEVESQGRPFDEEGRLIILPEKHVFFRELPKSLRARARALGLAVKSWSRANYAGLGAIGSPRRWQRLREMASVDETAALKATSYGGPQIMGFNHGLCGWPAVADFVLALAESEVNQVDAFIRYLEGVGLAEELRERDWHAIARRYNGPGQVAHYAGLMQSAFERITGEDGSVRDRVRKTALRLGSRGERVAALQRRLSELGYHLVVDGDFGPATRRAVVAFQADHGLGIDGVVGPKTRKALTAAVPIRQQPGSSRENLAIGDLRRRGSQTVKQADRLTLGGWIALLLGGGAELARVEAESGILGWAAAVVKKLRGFAEPVFGLIAANPGLGLAVAAAFVIFIAWRIKERRLEDARNWKNLA